MLNSHKPVDAITHGVSFVLRNENKQEFRSLEREYMRHYSPVGPSERKLVEGFAAPEWRHHRVRAIETAELEKSVESLDERVRTASGLKKLADNASFVRLMARYEMGFSRQYDHALRRLLAFQHRCRHEKQNLPNEPEGDTQPIARNRIYQTNPRTIPSPIAPKQNLPNELEDETQLMAPKQNLPNEPDNNKKVDCTPIPPAGDAPLTQA
jgi:hypothetical protein